MSKRKNNFYSVAKGRTVGIFTEWSQCEESIHKYHNCVHKGHRTLDQAIRFMVPSGFTCQNIVIYDENMLPKKPSDFGHKCAICSDSVPKTAIPSPNDSDNEIDLSETFITYDCEETATESILDSEETIVKSIDSEETIPKSIVSEEIISTSMELNNEQRKHVKTSTVCSCIKDCMQPDSETILQCSKCCEWVHYKCSELPIYMLYSLVHSKRKFTCVKCVHVTEEWLAINKDLKLERTYKTVSCGTQTDRNTTMSSAIQATCQQVTQSMQSEETVVNKDLELRDIHGTVNSYTQTHINTTVNSAAQATCKQATQCVQSEVTAINRDLEVGKISDYEYVSCSTQTNINTTMECASQATCQQVTQSVQSEELNCNLDENSTKENKTEEGNFSVNDVKKHINEVVHQLEITLVNSLTNQKLNTSESEINNLKLEIQTTKDEKQQIKNDSKLLKQQLQDEKEKNAKYEMDLKNLQTDNVKLRDDNKHQRDKGRNLKIQLQSEHEKCNKHEIELNNLKHEYQNKTEENKIQKDKYKSLKLQLQAEKDTLTKTEQQLKNLQNIAQSKTNSQKEDNQTDKSEQNVPPAEATGSRFAVLRDDCTDDDDLLVTHVSFQHDKANKTSQSKSQQNSEDSYIKDSCKNDKKVLLLGNSHLSSSILEDNLIKNHVVEKHICFTIEEGATFLKNSKDSYECIFLHFITNDVKKQSVNLCIEDFNKLIEICSTKWSTAKIIISTGFPRGDSSVLNEKVHTCNIKLQGQYIETENISFCDNSSVGIRGNPNMQLFSYDRVHLSGNGIRVFAKNIKVSISKALKLYRQSNESDRVGFRQQSNGPNRGGFGRFNGNFGHTRGTGRGSRPRGRGSGYGRGYRGYRPQSGFGFGWQY